MHWPPEEESARKDPDTTKSGSECPNPQIAVRVNRGVKIKPRKEA